MSAPLRYPGRPLRHAWPLAVSLGVHLLLVLAWLQFGAKVRLPVEAPQPLTVLLLPRPAPQPLRDDPPLPAPAPHAAHVPKPAPGAAASRPAPGPAAPAAQAPPPAVIALPAPPAPSASRPSAADILAAARQDIGKIDREVRGNKAAPLRAADSAWTRFEQRVDNAHIERGPAPVTEAYTAPDGVTYYRTKVGNSYVCRKTGTGDPSSTWKNDREIHANSLSTLGMGQTAGVVLCPESDRGWVRQ
jgi:hypothetical protein